MHGLLVALTRYGVPLVFANVLFEQVGVPLPAIPTLVLAGALSADGTLPFWGLLGASVGASLVGDLFWFLLGRRYGHRILKGLCRISLSPDSCVRQTEGIFDRWGLKTLLVAKFIPGLSTVAPPLAGSGRVGLKPFLLFSAGGALLWAGSGLALGFLFHDAVDHVVVSLGRMGGGALALLGGAFVVFLAAKWWERRLFYRKLRMARIPPAELHRLMSDGAAPMVVDVRSKGARAGDPRRIRGAVVLDIADLDAQMARLPKDREIVLYCT